jgi:ATP-dependent Lon protease
MKRVILPRENERDLEDIPADISEAMEFHLVDSMDEVVTIALDGTILPLEAKESHPEAEKRVGGEGTLTH